MSLAEQISRRCFEFVHQNHLVYNTCWEDPRLDRQALRLGPDDHVLVITSAGCNALDYLLDAPARVSAVDLNPRQNALLELKVAGIRALDFTTFFELFGSGRLDVARDVYHDALREHLSVWAQHYWDRRIDSFARRSFYFCGTSGSFARFVNFYIDRVTRLREAVEALCASQSLAQQQELYYEHVKPMFWSGFLRWLVGRDSTLSLLGVPRAQREHVEAYHPGGMSGFIEQCLDAVFAELPLVDNYFRRVYLTGRYTRDCCPEYLKRENFLRLKAGLVDRLSIHTHSVQGFLETTDEPVSRFVLLDHMDWLATRPELLQGEWQAIIDRATPEARVLWRSGGLRTDFVDRTRIELSGISRSVGEVLEYHREEAEQLHRLDRVHTYGSFCIADLVT